MHPQTLQTPVGASISLSVDADVLAEQAQCVLDELDKRREPCQTQYSVDQVQQALIDWLQESVEQLLEEAAYHCCTGSNHYACNRDGFNRYLQRANTRPCSHHAPTGCSST